MDTTIRNLDERAYRALKARAALTGRTIGETVNEAIRVYLARLGGLPVLEAWPTSSRPTIPKGTNA